MINFIFGILVGAIPTYLILVKILGYTKPKSEK